MPKEPYDIFKSLTRTTAAIIPQFLFRWTRNYKSHSLRLVLFSFRVHLWSRFYLVGDCHWYYFIVTITIANVTATASFAPISYSFLQLSASTYVITLNTRFFCSIFDPFMGRVFNLSSTVHSNAMNEMKGKKRINFKLRYILSNQATLFIYRLLLWCEMANARDHFIASIVSVLFYLEISCQSLWQRPSWLPSLPPLLDMGKDAFC